MSLVNFLLLASLEERSTYEELDCFLETEDRDGLEEDVLVDKTGRDRFILFQDTNGMTGNRSFSLLLGVRLKSLFFCLSCIVVFTVTFLVVMINSYHQSIHILEQGGFSLFPGRDRILDLIWESLVVAVA